MEQETDYILADVIADVATWATRLDLDLIICCYGPDDYGVTIAIPYTDQAIAQRHNMRLIPALQEAWEEAKATDWDKRND